MSDELRNEMLKRAEQMGLSKRPLHKREKFT